MSPACVRVPLTRDMVGEDGLVIDATARAGIAAAVLSLAEHIAGRSQ